MSVNSIILPDILRQQIIEYAMTDPGHEVCGLLSACGQIFVRFYPVENIAENRTCEFLMDPRQQISVIKDIRENSETMAAIFHSHPTSPAEPSTRDLALAYYPEMVYLILSLQGEQPELRAHYFDGKQFQEVEIKKD